MAKETAISWCDSTLNLMMGCDGCELWNLARGVKICYAGAMTEGFAGLPGWPPAFERPTIFPERVAKAASWSDLTGLDRPGKPWLNGLPRLIFLNDMGDTFTKSLGLDWFAPFVDDLARTPHVYILLTKRAAAMAEFWRRHGPPPRNFWLLVSVTSAATWARAESLLTIEGAAVRGISYEPANGPLDAYQLVLLRHFDWVIFGGESMQTDSLTTPCDLHWCEQVAAECRDQNVPCFVKQLGSNAALNGKQFRTRDPKGEDWDEFPLHLKVRQMPPWRAGQGSLFG